MKSLFPAGRILMQTATVMLLCCAILSAEARSFTISPDLGPAPKSPTDIESAKIRHLHLARLMEKPAAPPEEPEGSCRYESEILTPPPTNRIALTFDDGPQPGKTEQVLDVLAQHGISATFFMIGKKAALHPELVARVREAGHQVVANHSWSHPNFHELDAAQQVDEIVRGDALVSQFNGPKLFRYPYGNATCAGNALIHQRGYKIVGWHIDSCDWAFERSGVVARKDAHACGVLRQYRRDYVGHVVAKARARKGGIILMHETHTRAIRQLESLIEQLIAAGFTFGTVTSPEFQASLR
ncbi:polysaccharide deacetylase family protein [Pseudoduganella violaceinigra]|uniref:polysaccharide deacetylase family protein n=1 Tax=Pseudoduganella violaceinigra TaxID=246602 RepID=UPI0003FE213B|nr:polysaccharide deacetylase family protein [Pseudoduganella violaceinigra]